MSSKAFLLDECENVKDLLEKTLRHDYGLDSSQPFFDECSARLQLLTEQLNATDAADVTMLGALGRFLSELAQLICRIERSSLGEYSWPFVHELKKIATAICRENTLASPDTPPHVYVFADGGLASYAIYTEQRRPTAAKERLLTIVFPKSLKNFVLLHTILGHELGHAILQCSKHQRELIDKVLTHLVRAGGALENPAATAKHLYSASAPKEFRDLLAVHANLTEATIFSVLDWSAWIEEILCDLIGLVTFGPGFLAAQARLLYSVNPAGTSFGPKHPPVVWRFNMIRTCASILGYDTLPPAASPILADVEAFWKYVDQFKNSDPWCDVLPAAQLQDAITGVRTLLDAHPPSSYSAVPEGCLESLLAKLIDLVPPVGSELGDDDKPLNTHVDFRHIIYAGWIATQNERAIPFKRINQLCEHAIMQQHAISKQLNTK